MNQIVGHGWLYTPPGVAEPGWSLYAAGVFDEHNPWFAVMPDVTRYLPRGSWLLRQGEPVTDVAILLPENDAQASFTPGHVSITDEMKKRVTPELMRTILDAGYNVHYVDAATLGRLGEVPYPILVLPPTERMPLDTARLLATFVARGGHVIATGAVPTFAPGFGNKTESLELVLTISDIFNGGGAVQLSFLAGLDKELHNALAPDMAATIRRNPVTAGNDVDAGLGFVHRAMHSPQSDLHFVVNSSNGSLSTKLRFRARHTTLRELSLDTGFATARHQGTGPVLVTLAPYESRLLCSRMHWHRMVFRLNPMKKLSCASLLPPGCCRLLKAGGRSSLPTAQLCRLPGSRHRRHSRGESLLGRSGLPKALLPGSRFAPEL